MTTETATTEYQIGTYEENGYHDSYFYAVTYTPSTGKFGSTMLWATAYAGSTTIAKADAAVLDAARIRLVEILTAAKLEDAKATRLAPRKGVEVRSLTTRGKNKDVVGIVKWIGEDNTYRRGTIRVGIKVEGEPKLRYLDADRVEATTPAPISFRDIYRSARTAARHAHATGAWYHALRSLAGIRAL